MKNSLFKNYLDLFDKNCNKKPNAIAVKFGSQSLTYSNLSKKINQLANYLIDLPPICVPIGIIVKTLFRYNWFI